MKDHKNVDSGVQVLRNWAKAELSIRQLAGERVHGEAQCGLLPGVKHPAVLVQVSLQETFRPSSPVEIFSDKQPQFRPQTREEESSIPIDQVLGHYNYRTRSIEIFHKNIHHFARSELKCQVSNLESIVRIHEYAHALLHLGLSWNEDTSLIRDYNGRQETDWKTFLQVRSNAFRSLRSDLHEFIAQVLSWMVIGLLQPLSERNQLQELFVRLMERQPAKYVLSDEILGQSLYGDPTLLLAWAREPTRRKPPTRRGVREAAEELLRLGVGSSAATFSRSF